MTKVIQYLLSSFLLCLIISSCAPTRHLQPKEVLLVKNKVENLKKYNEDPLKDIIKQDPNRKLVGFWRFHLQMWNLGYNYQDKRIGFWLMNSIGEKPVILDTFLVRKSKEQMQEYLFQEGYFKAQVTDSIAYLPKNSFIKKKAKVYYTPQLGEPYIIKKVNTFIQDPTIQYLEGQIKDNTVLKVGTRYQYSLLEEERKRLTALMQKNGYYDFNKSYIRFVVDTTQGDYEVALSLKIQIVTQVSIEDLEKWGFTGPLAGVNFQKDIEKKSWEMAGKTQAAPAQLAKDFLKGKLSSQLPERSSYIPGIVSSDITQLFPRTVTQSLQAALKTFNQKMKGFAEKDALIIAPETRTSSPVRIPRDKVSLQHPEIKNLYPCGEGAGYAGGIISAAIDGENCAEAIVKLQGNN